MSGHHKVTHVSCCLDGNLVKVLVDIQTIMIHDSVPLVSTVISTATHIIVQTYSFTKLPSVNY